MAEVLKVAAVAPAVDRALDVAAVHAEHAEFVWASLARLGVAEADLPDMLQEVFVVVHRRRGSYDGEAARLRTWLYGICMRVASNYRRKAHRRRERALAPAPLAELPAETADVEDEVAARRAREEAEAVLALIRPERRAILVMFEVEGLPCAEIAKTLGVPLGTVYSRLHAARRDLARALSRWESRRRRTR